MSISALIKKLQDIMRKDPGVDGDVQRLNQFVWMIFLMVYDYKEEESELDDSYIPVIPIGYRWRDWANPLNDSGEPDLKNQLTGDELISFVDTKLMPVLKGDAINVDGKQLVPFEKSDDRALLVKKVMGDATNLMKSGYFLREVINLFNQVDLSQTIESHEFSVMYEGLMDGLQAMGKYGEFHTIKAITEFSVDKIDPKLGEIVADWACGTGGFLVDAVEKLRKQVRLGHNEDYYQLQKSVIGGEFKPMPFRLCVTNMLLHGIDMPNIRYGDSLDFKNFSEYYGDDLVDVACLNPPYGGVASDSDKLSFPSDMRSSETADLFVALTVKRLKKNGRAVVVVPDGFLFGNDNAKVAIKKFLLKECNLHTIIRLPQSCFAPYTSIATNLLFFEKTGSTKETWFYRLDIPKDYKHFSKTKPMKRHHFTPVDEWWDNRVEIIDDKAHEDVSDTFKSRKYSLDVFEKNNFSFDLCGYPKEEKIILSPEDTIKVFAEKRKSLDDQIDAKLMKIFELLEIK
jgi:type I restriction enzyme M protein